MKNHLTSCSQSVKIRQRIYSIIVTSDQSAEAWDIIFFFGKMSLQKSLICAGNTAGLQLESASVPPANLSAGGVVIENGRVDVMVEKSFMVSKECTIFAVICDDCTVSHGPSSALMRHQFDAGENRCENCT